MVARGNGIIQLTIISLATLVILCLFGHYRFSLTATEDTRDLGCSSNKLASNSVFFQLFSNNLNTKAHYFRKVFI